MNTRKLWSMLLFFAVACMGLVSIGCGQQQQPAENASPTAAAPPGAAASASAPAPPGAAASASAPGGVAFTPATEAEIAKLPGYARWKGKKDPVADNPANLAKGKQVFLKNCAPCHGDDGKGDGPAGVALDPKPRDFTTGKFQFGDTDGNLMRTVMDGIPNTGMAGWNGRISDQDGWTTIQYVKSLAGKK